MVESPSRINCTKPCPPNRGKISRTSCGPYSNKLTMTWVARSTPNLSSMTLESCTSAMSTASHRSTSVALNFQNLQVSNDNVRLRSRDSESTILESILMNGLAGSRIAWSTARNSERLWSLERSKRYEDSFSGKARSAGSGRVSEPDSMRNASAVDSAYQGQW